MDFIKLNKIIPVYIKEENTTSSDIWNRNILFEKGVIYQIIAPSGTGKTSLLHILYGMKNDYLGSLEIQNQKLQIEDKEKLSAIRSNVISIVFQDLRLFHEHTSFENLDIKRSLNPYHKNSRIEDMAKRLGVFNKLQQKIQTCSYGEQQRISIIRALQQPFNFLLLDEPFSHLDDRNSELAWNLILEEVKLRNAAVILADLRSIPFINPDKTLHL